MPAHIAESNPLEFVYQPLWNGLARLIHQVNVGRAAEADFENVMFLLETLPLATDEFGTACLRLAHASRYRDAKEISAATWEIRTVMLQLRTMATAQPFLSRRRSPNS